MAPFAPSPAAPQESPMKDPYVLFAASLFLGCTLADAQSGPAPAQPQVAAARGASANFQVNVSVTGAEEQGLFAEAVDLYRAGRWSAAYGRFATLADRGHVRSARIALAMFRDGPSLYGLQWEAAPAQLDAWRRAAAHKPADPGPLMVVAAD